MRSDTIKRGHDRAPHRGLLKACGLSDADMEDTVAAVRRARAVTSLKNIRSLAVKTGRSKMTMEEIDAEIQKARQEIFLAPVTVAEMKVLKDLLG